MDYSTIKAILAAAAGRPFDWWAATLDGTQSLPDAPVQPVAVQYTDTGAYDISLCQDYWPRLIDQATFDALLAGNRTLIYLTGTHCQAVADAAADVPLGVILTPNVAYKPKTTRAYRWWAADNGCFTQGANFRMERFLAWLDRHDRQNCLFVVAPDVPFDAKATLETFVDAACAVRGKDFPVALAAQNGLGDLAIPWADLDAIFVGGDTEWKLSHEAARICWEARARGKWVHMGRVNSRRRLSRALAMGCDSVDGTFLRWPRLNLPRLARWFDDLSGQTHLLDITA